ncbi:hypothetical protein [Reyranella sp.]|uniref:hypothetical protein n=1 Tax=Reyranella sp. TaxID=1929291 RepID=UPI003BAC5254
MQTPAEQGFSALNPDPKPGCGRLGCACGLPIGDRFVLWALRQWQQDRALPMEGSTLHQGFKVAGLLPALADFAIAMDAFLFGARRAIEIHRPACSSVSRDEATLVALCGLAQGDFDGPLQASLDRLMAPTASRVAAIRLKTFASALAGAGLRLAPAAGDSAGRLN